MQNQLTSYLNKKISDIDWDSFNKKLIINQIKELITSIIGPKFSCDSGIIIDSNNNKSNNFDIIIYENGLTPIITLNEIKYFFSESVFCVANLYNNFEDKEFLKEINESSKIKKLNRINDKNVYIRFPGYTNTQKVIQDSCLKPFTNFFDNIFYFVFSNSNKITEQFLKNQINQNISDLFYMPDFIYTNNGLNYTKCLYKDDGKITYLANNPNCIISYKNNEGSIILNILSDISIFLKNARSQHFDIAKYFIKTGLTFENIYKPNKN